MTYTPAEISAAWWHYRSFDDRQNLQRERAWWRYCEKRDHKPEGEYTKLNTRLFMENMTHEQTV